MLSTWVYHWHVKAVHEYSSQTGCVDCVGREQVVVEFHSVCRITRYTAAAELIGVHCASDGCPGRRLTSCGNGYRYVTVLTPVVTEARCIMWYNVKNTPRPRARCVWYPLKHCLSLPVKNSCRYAGSGNDVALQVQSEGWWQRYGAGVTSLGRLFHSFTVLPNQFTWLN